MAAERAGQILGWVVADILSHMAQSNPNQGSTWLYGETARGKRPARSHDFLFLTADGHTLAVVGREIRDEWPAAEPSRETASGGAVDDIVRSLPPLGSDDPVSLRDEFERGFRGLVEATQRRLQEQGGAPAIALTVAHAQHDFLHIGHVGDGRCYLVAGGALDRLTEDQTYAPQPPDRPLVSDPAMSRKLSSVVGGFSDDLVIQTKQVPFTSGNIIVLCSGGVNRVLSDGDLEALARGPAGRSARALCEAVLASSERTLDGADRTVAVARLR